MRYLSASSGARVGGDLYEVVTTPECVRLVVGDTKGKGLPAVQSAAAVLGVFREAAHEEDSLAAIVTHAASYMPGRPARQQRVPRTPSRTATVGCASWRAIERLGRCHRWLTSHDRE